MDTTGWVSRLNTMDCGMEARAARAQPSPRRSRVRWAEERWEMGKTIALNLASRMIRTCHQPVAYLSTEMAIKILPERK